MILESLRAGVAFLPRAWGRLWFLALLLATAFVGLIAAAFSDTRFWFGSAFMLVLFLYLPLLRGPLYAVALGDTPGDNTPAAGAERYGRLVAVGLLTAIFLAIPGLLLFIVGLGTSYGMAWANPGFDPGNARTWTASGPVIAGGGLVFAIGALGLGWLSARVSLGPAATVVERRVLMLSSWPLTRGLGWRILVARLIMTAVMWSLLWGVAQILSAVTPPGWLIRYGPVLSGVFLLAVYVPLEIGVLSFFHARRSPLPVPP